MRHWREVNAVGGVSEEFLEGERRRAHFTV